MMIQAGTIQAETIRAGLRPMETIQAGWRAKGQRRRQAAWRASCVLLATGWLIAGAATPAAAQISRVSTTSANGEANGASTGVDISADGRFVAFVSSATNLVANDTNASPDLFVKDLQTGAVTRVSVRTDGTEAVGDVWMPELSNDGRYVAFLTKKALVPEDTNPDCGQPMPCGDVYVHDRQTGVTTRESVGNDGAQAEMWIDRTHLSGNGRFVLFSSPSTNLTPNWTLPGLFLFLRDRQLATTTRVPLPGMAFGVGVRRFAISDDGQVIAFSVESSGTDNTGDTIPCADRSKCERVYVHTRQNGETKRIEPAIESGSDPISDVRLGDMSADGRYLLILPQDPSKIYTRYASVFDRATSSTVSTGLIWGDTSRLALSGDGRSLVRCELSQYSYLTSLDLVLRTAETHLEQDQAGCVDAIAVSANGSRIAWDSTRDTLVPGDTNGVADIFLYDNDVDGDGIPSPWETRFGLDPQNPADALQDPDGDGVSSLAEYRAGSHPNGIFKRYFAEGAANEFFDYRVTVYAELWQRAVSATYVGANGRVVTQMFQNSPGQIGASRSLSGEVMLGSTWRGSVEAPDSTFSVMFESSVPFAADRTMTWGGARFDQRYGSTTLRAIEAPSTLWHFAEGATGPYSLYYLLQNPGNTPAKVTIHYLRPAQAPIVLDYTLAPHSRKTIDVNAEPGLASAEVSARIVSDVPILAERSMYFSTPTQVFAGGHIGAGIAAPATEWFVAEGATGFFKTYLAIANPSEQAADLLVSYLLADGTRIDVPHVVDGERRLSIDIASEDPRLTAATMSVIVTSGNSVPVVVERVSYWPSDAPIESSLTAGSTERGRRWAVVEAPLSSRDASTYLLIANPTGEAGNVRVAVGGVDDYTSRGCNGTYAIQPHSRLTVDLRELCNFSYTKSTILLQGTVVSDGPAIVVERSTYFTKNGEFWGIGDSAALTRLPDVP